MSGCEFLSGIDESCADITARSWPSGTGEGTMPRQDWPAWKSFR